MVGQLFCVCLIAYAYEYHVDFRHKIYYIIY